MTAATKNFWFVSWIALLGPALQHFQKLLHVNLLFGLQCRENFTNLVVFSAIGNLLV